MADQHADDFPTPASSSSSSSSSSGSSGSSAYGTHAIRARDQKIEVSRVVDELLQDTKLVDRKRAVRSIQGARDVDLRSLDLLDAKLGPQLETATALLDSLKRSQAVGADVKADGKEFLDLVASLDEYNGLVESNITSLGSGYIDASEFYHTVGERTDASRGKQFAEMFYNWRACGKGVGGMFAAAIRWGARAYFDLDRESYHVDSVAIPQAASTDAKQFAALLKTHKEAMAVVEKQWRSVAALNCAHLISVGHHWSSQNLKPWKALVASLNVGEILDENEYRKPFYLALHPLPLPVIEAIRNQAVNGNSHDVVNSVVVRCSCAPATTGAFLACVAAIPDVLGEEYGGLVSAAFGEIFDQMRLEAGKIRSDPAAYCPLAFVFGKDRRTPDFSKYKSAMNCLVGYIFGVYKGTLAKSLALKKIAGPRSVGKWRDLFESAESATGDTLQNKLNSIIASNRAAISTETGGAEDTRPSRGAREDTVPTYRERDAREHKEREEQ